MRPDVASLRVGIAREKSFGAKGFLGPILREAGVDTVGMIAGRARGLVVDSFGKLHCPPVGPTANEFTDMQMTGCILPRPRSALSSVTHPARKSYKRMKRLYASASSLKWHNSEIPDGTLAIGSLRQWPSEDGISSVSWKVQPGDDLRAEKAQDVLTILEREYPGLLDITGAKSLMFVENGAFVPEATAGEYDGRLRQIRLPHQIKIQGELIEQDSSQMVKAVIHEIGHAFDQAPPAAATAAYEKLGRDPATAPQLFISTMLFEKATGITDLSEWWNGLSSTQKEKWMYGMVGYITKKDENPWHRYTELFADVFRAYVMDGTSGDTKLDAWVGLVAGVQQLREILTDIKGGRKTPLQKKSATTSMTPDEVVEILAFVGEGVGEGFSPDDLKKLAAKLKKGKK